MLVNHASIGIYELAPRSAEKHHHRLSLLLDMATDCRHSVATHCRHVSAEGFMGTDQGDLAALSEAQREIMEIVWEKGELSFPVGNP